MSASSILSVPVCNSRFYPSSHLGRSSHDRGIRHTISICYSVTPHHDFVVFHTANPPHVATPSWPFISVFAWSRGPTVSLFQIRMHMVEIARSRWPGWDHDDPIFTVDHRDLEQVIWSSVTLRRPQIRCIAHHYK